MSDLSNFANDASVLELIDLAHRQLQSKSELEVITALRKQGHEAEQVRFAVSQAVLRIRAGKKLGEKAKGMLFTEAGLEQATRSAVADWHAQLLKANAIQSVTDLGCGIGSDSLAFAEAGLAVTAVEQHPDAYLVASHNLENLPKVKVLNATAESVAIETEAIYVDPARRDQDKKSKGPVRLAPSDFSPSLDLVFHLARTKPALIKLSPAFPHDLIPSEFEANWVSHQGDLVEVLLKSGSLGKPGSKKAVMVSEEVFEFEGEDEVVEVQELSKFIFEPDASLVRSHLVGAFAKRHGLGIISSGIAYLTKDEDLATSWLKRYRVVEVLPLSEKDIRRYCAENNIGSLEIKKRGVDITPEALRPKLTLKGTGVATLILTKVGDARRAIVCESIR